MFKRILFGSLSFIILVLLSSGCVRHIGKIDISKNTIVYPPSHDSARIQYLTTFSNSLNSNGQQSAVSRFIYGDAPVKVIRKPYGVAVHSGKIYICDTGLGTVEIIDLEKNTFDYLDQGGEGKLKLPINCSVDEEGNLYVADGLRMQIVVFDSLGKYKAAFGEAGDKFKPTDVFVTADRIWVANVKNNKICVYSKSSHELLYTFPDIEQGQTGFLYSPANLYVTSDKVYVSDIGDFRIKTYTLDGKYISSVGSNGTKPGQFSRPKGIAVDHDSNIYVVDASFENTQLFNKDGKLLMFFGGPYKGPGDMWLPAKVAIDYDNLRYFEKYVDPAFDLNYLIFVTNQYGPDKVNVYGCVNHK